MKQKERAEVEEKRCGQQNNIMDSKWIQVGRETSQKPGKMEGYWAKISNLRARPVFFGQTATASRRFDPSAQPSHIPHLALWNLPAKKLLETGRTSLQISSVLLPQLSQWADNKQSSLSPGTGREKVTEWVRPIVNLVAMQRQNTSKRLTVVWYLEKGSTDQVATGSNLTSAITTRLFIPRKTCVSWIYRLTNWVPARKRCICVHLGDIHLYLLSILGYIWTDNQNIMWLGRSLGSDTYDWLIDNGLWSEQRLVDQTESSANVYYLFQRCIYLQP